MKINEQNSPAKTQPISLTDEAMFDLEELTEEEMSSVQGGAYVVGVGDDGTPGIYRVQGQKVPAGNLVPVVRDALGQVVSNPLSVLR